MSNKKRNRKAYKKRTCPRHSVALIGSSTRYGKRFDCPIRGCNVMCWDGSTSTPADQPTRDARHEAHEAFDPIWKEGWLKRSQAYKELARLMKLTPDKTHIGMFNLQQCLEVLEHAATIMKGFEVNPEKQAEIAQALEVKPEDMTERQKHLAKQAQAVGRTQRLEPLTPIPPGAGKARRMVELTDHNLATRLIASMRKRIAHNQELLVNYYADDSKRDKSKAFISVEDAARLRGETMALIGVLDECGVTVAADGVAENVRLLERVPVTLGVSGQVIGSATVEKDSSGGATGTIVFSEGNAPNGQMTIGEREKDGG